MKRPQDERIRVVGIEHVEARPVVVRQARWNELNDESLQRRDVSCCPGRPFYLRQDLGKRGVRHLSILHSAKVLCELREIEGHRVHAIAEPGWTWTIVEYVAKVRIATPAGDGGSLHAE